MKTPPLSLYVHLPWCVRKCPYCDFNSHTAGNYPPRQRYLDALLADLEQEARRARERQLETIFLGGGTPSLFPPEEIARLLEGVRARFDVAADAEITMEANPGTVECGNPAAYRDAGVNRLSIGGQSFDNDSLRALGRIHESDDIRRAVEESVHAGFDNVNIDLMHGLPGQTCERALADLEAAVELGPTHISWYQLTLEPNTVFYARPPGDLPDEETAWQIFEQGQALLAGSGYVGYEVSAFARSDRQCRHNLNYWLFGDYVAVGAGAHAKITAADRVSRYHKPANPLQYMQLMEERPDDVELGQVSGAELVFEFMLNALRLSDGFSARVFCERTGLSRARLDAIMSPAAERGFVERTSEPGWRASALGRRFLNDLQAGFLPEGT